MRGACILPMGFAAGDDAGETMRGRGDIRRPWARVDGKTKGASPIGVRASPWRMLLDSSQSASPCRAMLRIYVDAGKYLAGRFRRRPE